MTDRNLFRGASGDESAGAIACEIRATFHVPGLNRLFFPTEDGIRVKFPEPTQTMHIPAAHMKELIALLIKFLEKEVEKQKWGPLSGD